MILRKITSFLIILLLAGCSATDQPTAANADQACASFAAIRAQDAADNGYGSEVQRGVRDRTYKDCITAYQPVAVLSSKPKAQ